MEFIVNLPANLPAILENNGEEIKAWLTECTQKYTTLVVTADAIKDAKDDKAKLNKLRAALEERRKEVKRDYLKPYEAFEAKYKELLKLIDEPIDNIDKQIKAFDEIEAQQKYDELTRCFEENRDGVPDELKLDQILNPKWRNKTMKLDALKNEITVRLQEIRNDIQELKQYYGSSQHYVAIVTKYREQYNKSDALAYAAYLQTQEQAVKEPEPMPEPQPEPMPEPVQQPQPVPQQPTQAAPAQPMPEPMMTGMFRVTGTRSQIIALRDFMKQSKIQFELVK